MSMPDMDTFGLLFKGKHPVIDKTLWNVNVTGIQGPDGYFSLQDVKGAVDTGAWAIVGSTQIIDPIVKDIVVDENCRGVYKLPTISISIDDTEYELSQKDYVIKTT